MRIASAVRMVGVALMLTGLAVTPSWAQGRGQSQQAQGPTGNQPKSRVTMDLALGATREVLVARGFEVLRIEVEGDRQIVHYRAGNRGRGRGHGPPQRMVLRFANDALVVDEAPEEVKLEIGIKLGIRL